MVFWGTKLKPKRPYFLDPDQYEGSKLRITNATPGKTSDKRAIIKCKVGDGPEICICSFKPGAVKTTQLELEFEEPVQFVLSGSAPVYLSGYFYDYQQPDREESEDDEEDDSDYEFTFRDGFINDDEEDVSFEDDDEDEEEEESDVPELVPQRSSVKIEEIDEDQAKAQQNGPKLLEAPAEPMKTDQDDNQAAENEKSEDEDGLPVGSKRKVTSTEEPSTKKNKPSVEARNEATPASGKKKKKKDKKKQKAAAAAADIDADEDNNESPEGKTEQKNEGSAKKSGKKGNATKKFSNGLEVEDLAMGKPDGKQAKAGKKVSIFYIGKLKSNGNIFDSNIGKRPFQFRLGINEVIKGLDVGVTGMRIGDKRRVTIPPAMGYGSKGVPGIPPNSWLVFDIELVDVKG